MAGKGKSRRGTIVLIAVIFLIIVFGGGTTAFLQLSLVHPVRILLPVAGIGFVIAFLLRKAEVRVSGNDSLTLNVLFAGLLLSSLLSFGFLGINYWLAGKDLHKETITVERLYSKTFHRSRRVGRRYTTNGEPYKVYYMEAAFSDGRTKEIRLGQRGYGKRKKGDRLELEIEKGFFGIPVIKSDLSRVATQKRIF